MSQALIAFDTDHIKRYVFGTSKLREIRGASSLLDHLNRVATDEEAKKIEARKAGEGKKFHARRVFANGGSALFLVESEDAQEDAGQFGQAVQKRYRQETGGGASITYAVQPIPPHDKPDIMQAGDEELSAGIRMEHVLKMLRWRLRQAKEGQQAHAYALAQPTHAFLCTCRSCGMAYAETLRNDPGEPEERYCRVCSGKREEDERIKGELSGMISNIRSHAPQQEDEQKEPELWERILREMKTPLKDGKGAYKFPQDVERPRDFQVFRELGNGRGYLGLIYADANGMGQAFEEKKTLKDTREFAQQIDEAVFKAVGEAIKIHLPAEKGFFPFDILLIGGDDIVLVVPAEKAVEVAHTLAARFFEESDSHTLSVGIILAPVAYPFYLQRELVEEILKDAKQGRAVNQVHGRETSADKGYFSFMVVTGSTSLSYKKVYDSELRRCLPKKNEEFYATLRPYPFADFERLLTQLQKGKELHLGRTKLHQLRAAILKLNRTTTILEALALFRNWKEKERDFIIKLVKVLDKRITHQERKQRGTLFPWYLEIVKDAKANADAKDARTNAKDVPEKDIYRTPLLDFIELYDFVSSSERG